MHLMNSQRQIVRYVTTADAVRLAWARSGQGSPLVKAANWITHLDYDWESPVWRHWIEFLSQHFSLIRYDERGNGLSQHDIEDVTDRHWLSDLEAVIDVARPKTPFALLGISQGAIAAIQFAARYPERVSQLIIYGGYARGWARRGSPEIQREMRAMIEFTELGWGRQDPIYRRLFTRRFLPEGSEEQLAWFDEHCATTTTPGMAAKLLRSRGPIDVTGLLGNVRSPTLVIHARNDAVTPLTYGQEIAAGIPNAQFVQLDSRNHILLESEPAWARFKELTLEFTDVGGLSAARGFAELSERENEILAQLVTGKTNREIGDALFISEKTVRNHITNIYGKLGVKTRAQAMVRAREQGFSTP